MAKIHYTVRINGCLECDADMITSYDTVDKALSAMKSITFKFSWHLVNSDYDVVSVSPEWDKQRCTVSCERPGVKKVTVFHII